MPIQTDSVIQFPASRIRSRQVEAAPSIVPGGPLVDHDGRLYPVRSLFRHLPAASLADVAEAAPQSAQAAWDLVCRRWPALAASIAASVTPVDERSA